MIFVNIGAPAVYPTCCLGTRTRKDSYGRLCFGARPRHSGMPSQISGAGQAAWIISQEWVSISELVYSVQRSKWPQVLRQCLHAPRILLETLCQNPSKTPICRNSHMAPQLLYQLTTLNLPYINPKETPKPPLPRALA